MFDLHASLQSALDAGGALLGTFLLSLGRAGAATLYRTTHTHNLSWNSQTWIADGLIVDIGSIPMPSRIVATNWGIALSGIDPQSQGAFNRQQATLYATFVSGGAVTGDAVQLGQGRMSVLPYQESSDQAVQRIDVEMIWNKGTRITHHARTDEAQRKRFSGDRAFRDLTTQRDVTTGGNVNIFR